MRINTNNKYNIRISGRKNEHMWEKFSKAKHGRAVTISKNLKIYRHVTKILSKVKRLVKFLSFEKRCSFVKAFVGPQFKIAR